jgi:uracil-DNA glycosylase
VILIVGQGPSGNHPRGARALEGKRGSGVKLAKLCGMSNQELLTRCRTANLLSDWHGKNGKGDKFPFEPAMKAAEAILNDWQAFDKLLLLGANVAAAFGLKKLELFKWHTVRGKLLAVIPHPSGINRWYNSEANRKKAQEFLRQTLTEEDSMTSREPEHSVQELTAMAAEHDSNLALAVSQLSQSIVEIGKELAIMQDDKLSLYRYVKDPKSSGDDRGCFRSWRDYARYRLGKMSTSKMYEYLSASMLTHGKKPLNSHDVEELGIKRAAQIARLPESKRTKKLVKEAKEQSVAEVKQAVDELLTPESERKAHLVPLTLGLPQEVVDLIADVERGGEWLEHVRDNDRTWTLRAKLWHQVWWEFYDNHREELKAAEQFKEDYVAKKSADKEAVSAQSVN